NACNPCILDCLLVLTRGDSLVEDESARVYLFGNPVGGEQPSKASHHIMVSILSKRNYLEHSVWSSEEELSVTGNVYRKALGMIIVNAQGQFIGLQTRNIDGSIDTDRSGAGPNQFNGQRYPSSSGWVAGPSMRAINHMIEAFLIRSSPNFCMDEDANEHVQVVNDPAGNFLIYPKAYLGAAYQVLRGVDYDTTQD